MRHASAASCARRALFPLAASLAAPLAVSLSAQRAPDPTPSPSLVVLSKTDHTLAIVDPATRQVLAKVPVGEDPHEVAVSSDGRTAYVSNYGGGAYHTITPVDLVAQKMLRTIELGALRGPHGLVFVGDKLWFTAEGSKVIGNIDPASRSVDWELGTGQGRTHMIYVAPDLKRIITSNVNSATISLFEVGVAGGRGGPGGAGRGGAGGRQGGQGGGPGGPPRPGQSEWDATVIPVGRGAEGFDVSPSGTELWAANALDGTISIIDVNARAVVQMLAVQLQGANRLKFTPDGKLVLVTSLTNPEVTVFDVATRKEVRRIPVGHGAAGLLMAPDGSHAYAACTPDGYVAVIDLKSFTVVGHIDAGPQPDGLAWAVRP